MSDARFLLLILGVAFDGAGILLVLAQDLIPYRDRLSAWLRLRWRKLREHIARIRDRLARLIGRPRPVVHHASAGGAVASGGSARGVISAPTNASLEQKVEYLLRREQDAQANFDAVSARLATIETRRFPELRHDMERYIADALAAAEREHRPLRVLGGLALIAGLICLTAASFV